MAGFVDLQVNGYVGVDFNNPDLTGDDLHRVCQALRRDGVDRILATVVTQEPSRMCATLANLARLRGQDELARDVVAGFHLEGPFLSPLPGYRGAHQKQYVLPADAGLAERLLEAGRGLVKLVTLAPEQDPGLRVTRMLAERGVIVSAGHTDASLELLREAAAAGVSMFTHLGNGCPLELPRHDNIVQRVLSLADRLVVTFIADLVHVPAVALGNYVRLVPPANLVAVTDCSAPAGAPLGHYRFMQWDVEVDASGAMWSPDRSHLLGSAATMAKCWRNLVALGLDEDLIRRATCDNPGRLVSPCA